MKNHRKLNRSVNIRRIGRKLIFLIFVGVSGLITSCEDEFTSPDDVPGNTNGDFKPGESTDIEGTFSLMNVNSGKLLAVVHFPNDEENEHTITQWNASNFVDKTQRWELKKVGDFHRIINLQTGKDLGINPNNNNTGGRIIETDYKNSDEQHWSIEFVTDDYYKIVNIASGRVLDVRDALCTSSALIQQVNYSNRDSRHWKLNPPGVGGSANGELTWKWVSTDVPADAKKRIENAMDSAVDRYNRGNKWPKRELTVEFNPTVPTADANINGHIRFGEKRANQDEQTALHEIAHTYGGGLSSGWFAMQDGNGKLTGEFSTRLYKIYEGDDALISYGGSHFWLYNLNFQREYSQENAKRHVEMVAALTIDGM